MANEQATTTEHENNNFVINYISATEKHIHLEPLKLRIGGIQSLAQNILKVITDQTLERAEVIEEIKECAQYIVEDAQDLTPDPTKHCTLGEEADRALDVLRMIASEASSLASQAYAVTVRDKMLKEPFYMPTVLLRDILEQALFNATETERRSAYDKAIKAVIAYGWRYDNYSWRQEAISHRATPLNQLTRLLDEHPKYKLTMDIVQALNDASEVIAKRNAN